MSFKAGDGGESAGRNSVVVGYNCDTYKTATDSFAGGQLSSVGVVYSYDATGVKTLRESVEENNVAGSFAYGGYVNILAPYSAGFGYNLKVRGSGAFCTGKDGPLLCYRFQAHL